MPEIPDTPAVVLVHGLWMPGTDTRLLAWRLRRCGFLTYTFRYPTVARSVSENAAALHRFLQQLPQRPVHLVGHSLGGLVIRALLHDYDDLPPGRIVTLGTPHRGSLIARRLARWALGRRLLGRSYPGGLDGTLPPWAGGRELGVIAGTLPVGLGLLVGGMPRPHDGTVALSETRLEGASDHCEVRASHLALLFSAEAARQTCHFLRHGRFDPSPDP